MKKLLLGSVLVLSGLNGYSQFEIRPSESSWASDQIHQTLSATSPSSSRGSSGGSSSTIQAPGDTIFYESFGNGLNGDGTNGAWTNSGAPSTALWEYRGTSTTPDNLTGSLGAYNNGRGPIASTTTSNGFFIFDSDYLDNGGTAGNFGLGQAPSPHTGYLESPTIDLTNYQNVVLQLTSFYRRFQSDCFIEFSIDGGSTWPYSIHVYGENEVSVNAATSDADITSHYVPFGVGGNANVKFRLKFDGTDTSNPNGSGYYFWQVDDIYIIEAPQNDLSVTEIYFDGVADSTASHKYHYALIPEQQAAYDTVNLGAAFENLGGVDQPNVKVGVAVTGPTTTSIISTGTIATVPVNTKDSLDAGTFSPNGGIGDYTYSFYAYSVDSLEDNKVNDTTAYNFEVTDNEYAWATATNIGYRTTTATSSYEICVYFDIYQADTAAGMRVEFNHNSNDPNDPDNLVPGSDFLAFRVIDANGFDNNNAYIGSNIAEYNSGGSTFYPVQAGDTNAVIDVLLTHTAGNPTLTPGGYYACVKTFNPNAFMSSDNSRSDDNWRTGTTIVDIDDQNDWGGFTVCPTITLLTKSSVDPCAGVTITASTVADESQQVGSITASASGGTTPYTYSWTYPDNSVNSGATISGLVLAGTYTLTVTDAAGCQSGTITQVLGGCVGLDDITTTESITFESSTGAADGAIDLTVSGGSGNLTFSWSAANNTSFSASTEDISNLSKDDYSVSITDNNCSILNVTSGPYNVWVDGIDDINFASELSVYPNPNNGSFVIDAKGVQESFSIAVRNVVGQTIHNQSFANQSIQKEINLGNPSAGVYFIEFESASGEIATYKMIIE